MEKANGSDFGRPAPMTPLDMHSSDRFRSILRKGQTNMTAQLRPQALPSWTEMQRITAWSMNTTPSSNLEEMR